MTFAGIDFSTRFVDVVLLNLDDDHAAWLRFPLTGQDAFDRARHVSTDCRECGSSGIIFPPRCPDCSAFRAWKTVPLASARPGGRAS